MAKKNKIRTFVALVLDQSSSMGSIRQETIDAFNQQVDIIKGMQTKDMDIELSLITFDTWADLKFAKQSVDKVEKLTEKTYIPNGMTAMYDGVGLAIETILHQDENDTDAYLVCIVSDGQENNSKRFSGKMISSKIKELQAKGNWTFTYLGANVDLSVIADQTGILIGNMAVFCATPQGAKTGYTYQSVGTQTFMGARGPKGPNGEPGIRSTTNFYNDKK
jgi:hypothetical protein